MSPTLPRILARISAAAAANGRKPDAICLLAVAKTRSAAEVAAVARAGVQHIGENYLQEALAKQDILAAAAEGAQHSSQPLIWHFIGAIQSNKTRDIANRFSWVHTLDRAKIARRLAAQRPDQLPALNVCIQVNIDDEASKAGCQPAALPELAAAVLEQPKLALRGLMVIPRPRPDPAGQRQVFAATRGLLAELQQQFPAAPLDTLSMGMSGDFEMAIAEGATMVRIGTALFGPRA